MKVNMIFLLSCCWFVIGQVHADLSFKESAKHKTAEGAYDKYLVTYELPGETHNKLTFRFDASKAGMPQGHYVLEIKMSAIFYYMLRKQGDKTVKSTFL